MKDLSKGDAEDHQAVRWTEIDDGSAGQRIDNYLLRVLKGVPKSHVYRILRSGEVRVNSRRIDATYRLLEGDRVRIPPVRTAQAAPMAPATTGLGNRVVFEDDFLIAIDKPAGVAVHGGSGVSSGVIERLRAERPQARFLELVHRLDRETSGLLLIAKKRSALTHLHDQLREGHTDKRYLALAQGRVRDIKRRVALSLHKFTTADGDRRVVVDAGGQEAETIFHRRERYTEATLMEAHLLTGRTHQIRVHLASIGHPIAGDDKYGDFAWNRLLLRDGLKRMFLHAACLTITHPHTGAALELDCPLPVELETFLTTLTPWTDATT